jgi:hypothetical protein
LSPAFRQFDQPGSQIEHGCDAREFSRRQSRRPLEIHQQIDDANGAACGPEMIANFQEQIAGK